MFTGSKTPLPLLYISKCIVMYFLLNFIDVQKWTLKCMILIFQVSFLSVLIARIILINMNLFESGMSSVNFFYLEI